MKRRDFIQFAGLSPLVLYAADSWSDHHKARPNIVFILADDMGYGDAMCYNPQSTLPTPNIDRLASQGVRFTDAHSGAAVCTPTRYGLLTGRYSWRTRMKSGVLNGFSGPLIEPGRMTVASLLKQSGYHTACIGKWHLGMDLPFKDEENKIIDDTKPLKNSPTSNGFDYFYGIPASLDFPPYVYIENERFTTPLNETQERRPFPAFMRHGPRAKGFKAVETLHTLTRKSVDYISERAQTGQPFFLYFPLTAPHKPTLPAEPFVGKTELGPYGDFITQVDWTVGRIMQALDQAGISDNTLLIFTSDNGSYMYALDPSKTGHTHDESVQGYKPSNHRANGRLRGTKADIYEAGHRVPFIARWPGVIAADRVNEAVICLNDFMATCARIVGARLPQDAGEDSFNLLPLFKGESLDDPRPAVIHQSANGTLAIREGRWKLILSSGSGGRAKPKGQPGSRPFQLYDMEKDPYETNNRIEQNPGQAKRLEAMLEKFKQDGRSVKP